jgi:hypothetical protein
VPATLAQLEAIVDASGVTTTIEAHMPTGGRPRQLPVRSLLIGLLAAIADDRPAHLSRAHAALIGLPDAPTAAAWAWSPPPATVTTLSPTAKSNAPTPR